ncbi:hypothetical protein MTBBW1_640022 [Desulfamplus magnetovallimortis]|uniref:Uncharacterized protein n=1 Tax=Desulfamplus magnetovallimortis TaxID=1246637 RepID=A0A1W1HIP8_9BACT|nr:hypothetical protein MTBBW1_640022 [Desulfamplus magnetovallimortis]
MKDAGRQRRTGEYIQSGYKHNNRLRVGNLFTYNRQFSHKGWLHQC